MRLFRAAWRLCGVTWRGAEAEAGGVPGEAAPGRAPGGEPGPEAGIPGRVPGRVAGGAPAPGRVPGGPGSLGSGRVVV
ncbi:MAG: hypothetical protein ACTSSA_02395 [Candidatus Freyarchaeota archaeon]